MESIKFEGTCHICHSRITGNGVSLPWRHDQRPPKTQAHQALPTGILRQL